MVTVLSPDMKDLLTSWKEIASYLGRTPRTVQRWEKDFQLPVHRPIHKQSRLVIADTDEIDHWAIEHDGVLDKRAKTNTDAERNGAGNEILQHIARKESSSTVFADLVSFVQDTVSCDFAEISLVDYRLKKLFLSAGPKMPKALIESSTFRSVGPGCGSCSAAIITRQAAIAVCVRSDPKWSNTRASALKAGIVSCWAQPIIVNGNAIGVVGAYFTKRKRPSCDHLTSLELASYIAGIALQMSGVTQPLDQIEMNSAFIGLDRAFRVRAINREAARLLDKSASEMVGQKLWDLYPKINPAVRREYNRALDENITVAFEVISSFLGSRLTIVARPSEGGLSVFLKEGALRAASAVA